MIETYPLRGSAEAGCATCHAPGAAADRPFTPGMDELTGVESEGVLCDFCHKVADVYLNPASGLPGKAFTKVPRDVESGKSPVVSYWKQALIVSDNRIPALGSDTSVYIFAAPAGGGSVSVSAELRFPRAFQEVMSTRAWDTPDIVMEEAEVTPSVRPWWNVLLPLVIRDA